MMAVDRRDFVGCASVEMNDVARAGWEDRAERISIQRRCAHQRQQNRGRARGR